MTRAVGRATSSAVPGDQTPASGRSTDERARRVALIRTSVAATVAAGVAIAFLPALRAQGLAYGDRWVVGLVIALGTVMSTATFQRLMGRGRLDRYPTLRIILTFAVFAGIAWTTGWSFLLPASGVLIAVVHVQSFGSRVWRAAALAAIAYTATGQLAVDLGAVPSVVEPVTSHVAAAWILVLSCLAIANVGTSVAHREAAGEALARTDARLRALMDSSTDILTVSDADGVLTYVSPAAERAMGYPPDELVGSRLLGLVDSDYRPEAEGRLRAVIDAGAGARASFDVLMVHTSRERRWYEWTVHNLLADPLVQGLVVDQRDVTERLLHQGALAYAAAHDDLTGLANRGELIRRLEAALPQASAGAGVAVLYMDLDHFKAVNDTYGHATGDELLVVVAQRLASCLRAHDHLARIGGDEFCAILTEISNRDEVRVVVRRLEAAVARPVTLSGGVVTVGVSIGAVVTMSGATDARALFAQADTAMYGVKKRR